LGETFAFLGVGCARVEEERARVNKRGEVGIFILRCIRDTTDERN
jgi:hypothetical protein